MPAIRRILVAGSAGRVGAQVARRLADDDVALRLLVRAMPQHGLDGRSEVMAGDCNEVGDMAQAFKGVDAAFMYAPDAHASSAVFQAAAAAGVRHVVLLSSASVAKAPPGVNPIAERHRSAENGVLAAGLDWTFIRPDTMASNCLQWAQDIRNEGRVYAAYPESMRNPVHESDIALLAVAALRDRQHAGRTYEVTGPACLSVREQVECIAALRGEPVACVRIEPDEALRRLAAANPGLSDQAAQRLLAYQLKSVSVQPTITDDFVRATGYEPRRFSEWVRDNVDEFRSPKRTASC